MSNVSLNQRGVSFFLRRAIFLYQIWILVFKLIFVYSFLETRSGFLCGSVSSSYDNYSFTKIHHLFGF